MGEATGGSVALARLRVLTIRQPWAWAIMEGVKDVENREWTTDYRGPLLIHAAKAPAFTWSPGQMFPDGETKMPPMEEVEFGAVLGIVDLDDVVDPEDYPPDDPWASGPYCWSLADPRRLEAPIACKGALGLWKPPPEVLEQVSRLL